MTTLMPVKSEKVSASEYLEMVEKEAHEVKKVRFVPPELGRDGFGHFNVEYKTPKLKKVTLGSFEL